MATNLYNTITGAKLRPGESYVNALGQTITQGSNIPVASSLPTVPLNLGIPPIDTTNYGGVIGGVASNLESLTAQQATDEQNLRNTQNDYTKIQEMILGKTADTQAANESSGLNAATQQLNNLNAQAQSLNREALAIPIQTQQRNANTGATDAGVAPQTTGALRENALKALSIAQQADVAMANYTAAKDKAQQIIDLKYVPLEQALAIKKQQYEFNKDILASVDKKRTEALGIAIKKQETELADKKATAKANADVANDYAKYAFDAGQSQLASQITSLDSTSPTFKADLAKLQGQIKNPTMALDIAIKQANLAKIQKETRLLGEPTAKEKKESVDALKNAKTSIPATQDKIDAVDALLNSRGLAGSVGANRIARSSPDFNFFTGVRQNFAGGVHKLVSGLTLDSLIAAKARGATFGALSEGELNILANSASAINDWEIKNDKGQGTGVWNIDEESFKTELKSIQELSRRALLLSQGQVLTSDEQSLMNNVFSPDNMALDPANYY